MKRTVSIIISMMCVVSALLFTSCKSDPIVGTWQSASWKTVVTWLDTMEETVINNEVGRDEGLSIVTKQIIIFDKDGSFADYKSTGRVTNSKWTLLDDGSYSIEPQDVESFKLSFPEFFDAIDGLSVYEELEKVSLIDDNTIERHMTFFLEKEGQKLMQYSFIFWYERVK